MNRTLLLLAVMVVLVSDLSAQMIRPSKPLSLMHATTHQHKNLGGEKELSAGTPTTVPLQSNFLVSEEIIGQSTYDLQTNSSSQSRLLVGDDGTITAAWILSRSFMEDYADRGTGINQRSNGVWNAIPDMRIEGSRTGWPSLIRLGDNSLHVTAHGSTNLLQTMKFNEGAWVPSEIPNATPFGLLWPRSAAGGPDGNTIHVIGLTTPSGALGGEIYEGVDGNLLYYRSLDGGETWDIADQTFEGIDSTTYAFISADNYTLVARDETIAMVVFGEWGDIALFKSTDNGATWPKTVISDFPLDGYVINSGYTIDEIPEDPFAPDSLAIYTSDGSGSAVIDATGMVHVTYADAYVMDEDTSDNVSSFFPGWSGISYWNESIMDPLLVGELLDVDGNDTIDIEFDDIPRYGNSTITSMPTMAIDDQGGIFIVYSAVSEANYNELDEQNYRHLIAIKSEDNGQTWSPGYDLINPEISDPEFYEFVEAVYPSAYPYIVDDTMHLIYQQDFIPGHRFIDSLDAFADNFIVHVPLAVGDIPSGEIVSSNDFAYEIPVKVYPTITVDDVQIEWSQWSETPINVQVFDVLGHQVHAERITTERPKISLSEFAAGSYYLRFSSEEGYALRKVIKH